MNNAVGKFLVFLGVGAFVLGGVAMLIGWLSKCANCHKWFNEQVISSKKISEKDCWRDINREDSHFDAEGKKVGCTKRTERVYGKEIEHEKVIRCSSCGYEHVIHTISFD